jgi:hypothetical protein
MTGATALRSSGNFGRVVRSWTGVGPSEWGARGGTFAAARRRGADLREGEGVVRKRRDDVEVRTDDADLLSDDRKENFDAVEKKIDVPRLSS